MVMKKQLLSAMAVVLLGCIVTVRGATIYEDENSKIDLYGRLSVDFNFETGYTGFRNNGSRLGLRGYHNLNQKLSAYGNFEARFDGSLRTGQFAPRETYFGVKGDFGDVRFGEFESVFDDHVSGISDIGLSNVWNYYSLGDTHDAGRNLAYYNRIGGVSFGIMMTHQERDTAAGTDQAFNVQAGASIPLHDKVTLGIAVNQDDDNFGGGNPIFGAGLRLSLIEGLSWGIVAETQNNNATNLGTVARYDLAGQGLPGTNVYGYVGAANRAGGNPNEMQLSFGSSYRITRGFRVFGEVNHRNVSGGGGGGTTRFAVGSRYDF